jgi:hypothetical protein
MLMRKDACRCHVGDCCLQLVLPAADDISFAVHHGVKADLGDLGRIILLCLSDRGAMRSARLKNSVSVAPGIRQLTVTPVSFNSSRNAKEKLLMKAFVPL